MKKFLLSLFCVVLLTSCVSALDFRMQNVTGDDLFIFNQTGDLWINGAYFGTFQGIDDNIISNVTALETRIDNVNTTGNLQELLNATGIYSTYNATYEGYAVNGTTISYQNITDIPTCASGQALSFDGTTLSCSDVGNFTNVAYTNVTNTFAENQVFSKDVNVTGNITLMTDTSYLKGIADDVGMIINSTGSIIFRI